MQNSKYDVKKHLEKLLCLRYTIYKLVRKLFGKELVHIWVNLRNEQVHGLLVLDVVILFLSWRVPLMENHQSKFIRLVENRVKNSLLPNNLVS